MRTKFYSEDAIVNDKRRFGAERVYYPAALEIDGSEHDEPLLFTPGEITVASERAQRNPEDVTRALQDMAEREMRDIAKSIAITAVWFGCGLLTGMLFL